MLTAALTLAALTVLTLAKDAYDFAESFSDSDRVFSLTGTVSSVMPPDIVLEDASGRARIRCEISPFPELGDRIAISGRSETDYSRAKTLFATSVLHTCKGEIPSPVDVNISQGIDQSLNLRRIRASGRVTCAFTDEIDANFARLTLRDGERDLDVSLQADGPITAYRGKLIRVTGTYCRNMLGYRLISGNTVWVCSQDDIEILGEGPSEDASIPSLNYIRRRTPEEVTKMGRRQIEGYVVAAWGTDRFLIRADDRQCVTVTLAGVATLPTVGSRVRATGFPDTDLFNVNLVNAEYFTLPPSGRKPTDTDETPAALSVRDLLTDAHGRPKFHIEYHGREVSLVGRIHDTLPFNGRIAVRSENFAIPVDFSTNPEALRLLQPGMTVKLTGVIILEADSWRPNVVLPRVKALALITRFPSDVSVISYPPWWTVSRLMWAICILLLVSIIVFVFNHILNRISTARKVAERTRLAVELHDSLSQGLSGVACQISAACLGLANGDSAATGRLESARQMLATCQTELRNCLFDLRSNAIDDPDFRHAVLNTLLQFDTEANIIVHIQVPRELLPDHTAHAIIAVMRELVGNALRHGQAEHIRVGGSVENKHLLLFSVRDDGCGFDPANCPGATTGHFGLSGVRNRLRQLGGTLDLVRNTDRGMYARITIPV